MKKGHTPHRSSRYAGREPSRKIAKLPRDEPLNKEEEEVFSALGRALLGKGSRGVPAAPSEGCLPPDNQPVWVPCGKALKKVRPELRAFVERTVQPLYRDLVAGQGGIESLLGASLLHLSWLETLQQLNIADEYQQFSVELKLPADVGDEIERAIRLAAAKLSLASGLLRLRHGVQAMPQPQMTIDARSRPVEENNYPTLSALARSLRSPDEEGARELEKTKSADQQAE